MKKLNIRIKQLNYEILHTDIYTFLVRFQFVL